MKTNYFKNNIFVNVEQPKFQAKTHCFNKYITDFTKCQLSMSGTIVKLIMKEFYQNNSYAYFTLNMNITVYYVNDKLWTK